MAKLPKSQQLQPSRHLIGVGGWLRPECHPFLIVIYLYNSRALLLAKMEAHYFLTKIRCFLFGPFDRSAANEIKQAGHVYMC